jgi:hypothetical protein
MFRQYKKKELEGISLGVDTPKLISFKWFDMFVSWCFIDLQALKSLKSCVIEFTSKLCSKSNNVLCQCFFIILQNLLLIFNFQVSSN